MSQSLITARKRSCGKVICDTCLSFCSQGVVWLWVSVLLGQGVCVPLVTPWTHPLETPPGPPLDTDPLDTHRPGHTHHLKTHTPGHTPPRQTLLGHTHPWTHPLNTPPFTVNKRAVHILLECFQTAIFFAL